MAAPDLFDSLAPVADLSEGAVFALAAVFTRIGAVTALLPGFGERVLSARLRLAAAVSMTLIVWPAVMPLALAAPPEGPGGLALALLAEAAVGLLMGLAIRMSVMALQLAGSIAAQSTSVSQIFGAGATPDPMPAIGSLLTFAGIALALSLGLHVKAAQALAGSYAVAPFGRFPDGADLAEWGVARAAEAFALAFSLAAPFAVASFAYNLALGAINRAMPQLMVAFIGAPAITGAALLLLAVCGPLALEVWSGRLDEILAAPLGVMP